MGTRPMVINLSKNEPFHFSANARNIIEGPIVINKYIREGGYFVTFKNEMTVKPKDLEKEMPK